MPSPEEYAVRIMDGTHSYPAGYPIHRQRLGDLIAAAIREAVTDALEQAAKIAEEDAKYCASPEAEQTARYIAAMARELKPKEPTCQS